MKRTSAYWTLVGLLVALTPTVAYAHVEESANGFMSGLLHPVFGLDHFLAMLSVGIVSAQLGGIRIFTVPAAFVGAMIVGGIVGVYGYGIPFSEQGIAASVVILGLAIVLAKEGGRSLPVLLITAFFGFLHGHAHGLEMPKASDPVYYAAGFVLSTASIHLLGVGVGHVLTMTQSLAKLLRFLGSGMASAGVMILVRGLTLG